VHHVIIIDSLRDFLQQKFMSNRVKIGAQIKINYTCLCNGLIKLESFLA
jgi:hypothetical protein